MFNNSVNKYGAAAEQAVLLAKEVQKFCELLVGSLHTIADNQHHSNNTPKSGQ